jgi:hypothetical protein
MQPGEHLLHRRHCRIEFLGIARTHHEIGIRLVVFVRERIAADDRIRMRQRDLA